MIREMFAYAKDHQPCIIFMDEIDAIGNFLMSAISLLKTLLVQIGGRRFSEGTSADREIQRTLMEVRTLFLESRNSFIFFSSSASQSNGWFRHIRQSENNHGNQSS